MGFELNRHKGAIYMLVARYDADENKLVADLSGDMNSYAAPELKEKLAAIDQHRADVVINCAELSYIDSTGLGVLVAVLKKAKDYDKSISIINLKPYIRKLFTITGLEKESSCLEGGQPQGSRAAERSPAEYLLVVRLTAAGLAEPYGVQRRGDRGH